MAIKKKWADREIIPVNLSFNQLKTIMTTYRQYQESSPEGRIGVKLLIGLKHYLQVHAEKGNLPPEIAEQLNDIK